VLAFWREVDASGEVSGRLGDQVVDRFEAARAEELIAWAQACDEMDAYKARMTAEAKARHAAEAESNDAAAAKAEERLATHE